MDKKNIVYIAKGNDPYENTRQVLSQMNLSQFSKKRVLLKPNAGRITPEGNGVTTDKRVVAATVDAFQEAGADVSIGESPIVGVNTHEAFEVAGITAVAKEKNCRLIDLNEDPYVKVSAKDGQAVDSFKVCGQVLAHDVLVSIPVMKTHMHTGASLSIKNIKGCLYKRSKVDLHMLPPVEGSDEKPINIAIADLIGTIRPHISIIDGTTGLEGLGPSAGTPKPFGVVVAGTDPFATDAVSLELMGIDIKTVPYLGIGARRGYGTIDLEKITVYPEDWRKWISPFETPPENISLEFPHVKVHDEQSCSACQSTLLLLLKRYREKLLDYFPNGTTLHFAIGKGNATLPLNTICIGNCTATKRKGNIFIKGCPPVESEIMTEIMGAETIDILDGRKKKEEPVSTIILASKSPRRKYLLEQAGINFTVQPSSFDESQVPITEPANYVKILAEAKAKDIAQSYPENVIIGADTIVVIDNTILGKPKNRDEAREMLKKLSGATHQVFTGFSIQCLGKNKSYSESVKTDVIFKDLTDDEIEWYIHTKEPFDKAGAYAIQGLGTFLVKKINGSYTNVVGLPVCEVIEFLIKKNIIGFKVGENGYSHPQ